MDRLLSHLADWKPFTALVVGDFMLDELLFGDAERLSADAPVPVLLARRVERKAGGAGSLCLDLAAMRGRVLAVGVAGSDPEGGLLRRALEDAGVEAGRLVEDGSRPTTMKRNIIGLAQQRHPQKMFRVDYESREPLGGEVREALLERFAALLDEADVVCVEDYAKGVCAGGTCEAIIEMARARGVPVLVDPASLDDYSRYRGATAITPNRNEAERATGLEADRDGSVEANSRLSAAMLEALEAEAIVLTLDRHGALLHERGREPVGVPTVARRVYDVTGAGDMFLAGLAAGRANGMGWLDATRLANVAAGLEVEVFGVEAIPIERIHHQVLLERGGQGKLRPAEELRVECASRRSRGETIVFTNGCFDVLHAGHVHLLDEARRQGDFLIVATNTDERIAEFKGPNRPVNRLEDRVRVLGALASVDAVAVFEEPTPAELIERLCPDVLVKGAEYGVDEIPGAAFVKGRGGRVVRVPMVEGKSTTGVLRASGDARAEVEQSEQKRAEFVGKGMEARRHEGTE